MLIEIEFKHILVQKSLKSQMNSRQVHHTFTVVPAVLALIWLQGWYIGQCLVYLVEIYKNHSCQNCEHTMSLQIWPFFI